MNSLKEENKQEERIDVGGNQVSEFVQDDSVDFKGRPSVKATSGRWRAAYFIMGTELLERCAYYAISLNLVIYLEHVLHQGTGQSVKNIFNWGGVSWILALLGGFLADAYTGKYRMIIIGLCIYFLGLLFLTLAVSLPSLKPPQQPACASSGNCEFFSATQTQIGFFYFALYLVSVGVGSVKPCLSALGGDQFDEDDEIERPLKRSFFNYWWFPIIGGSTIALTLLVYVEDHVSFGLGYGIPTAGLAIAILIFLSGTPWYRLQRVIQGSPLTEVAQVLTAAVLNFRVAVPTDPSLLHETDMQKQTKKNPKRRHLLHTDSLRFLDKAATPRNWKEEDQQPDYSTKVSPDIERSSSSSTLSNVSTSKSSPWRLCTVTQVEEVKLLVRVMPIWVFTLMFVVIVSQSSSFFVSTGTTMDLSMGPHFKISAASMDLVANITALLMILVYELCFVPLARRFTGNERGISMLQRIGVGLVISIIAMIVAAVVESKRLHLIKIHGLQNNRTVPVPMSVFWLTPQYSILGLAQVFSYLGLLEFFYDQAPDGMHSIGSALFASNTGVAHFLCTAIVDIVTRASGSQSGSGNHQSWIVNNINKCRVDKYYWTLAALSAINFCIYLVVAHWYTYKKVRVHEDDAESRKVVLQLTNDPNRLVKA
ncbi:hypothetical protein CY35_07G074900 [Sphagnum magellanicum]|uniref:Uncharacterized protein n=1 Tax=Sphagnum magellanicum TaxID=128215 RepID=A0ACB8HLY8_9BRYO|nr:hypothetical protein CY35_07G074900 [Sphagnum magellanicum]